MANSADSARPEIKDTSYLSAVEYDKYDREWRDWLDRVLWDVKRADGMAFLMRFGQSSVPCSRYGTRSSDCAEVAWRLSYIMARETSEPITSEVLEHSMGMVVNDHDDVAYMIRQYGHGMYR